MKNKKGDIWVSAVLYFGLGIIVISILLAAGLPVINKLRDKNILIQTKEAFNVLDENMLTVINGGPDSQRPITLEIKRGEINIDDVNDKIIWVFKDSKVFASDPTVTMPINLEGTRNIRVKTTPSTTKGRYNIEYILDYSAIADIISLTTEVKTLRGTTKRLIRNEGLQPPANNPAGQLQDKPTILIKQI